MNELTIFINDTIRDKHNIQVSLALDRPVDLLVEDLIGQFNLPRRNFNLQRINYFLLRAVDESRLKGRQSLRQAKIHEGELLLFVSPEGERVWLIVQKLLNEIENEINKLQNKLQEKVIEEIWGRVTHKLKEIEKTHTGGDRIKHICEWVDAIGGPNKLIELGTEAWTWYQLLETGQTPEELFQDRRTASEGYYSKPVGRGNGKGMGLFTKLGIATGTLIVLVLAYNVIFLDDPYYPVVPLEPQPTKEVEEVIIPKPEREEPRPEPTERISKEEPTKTTRVVPTRIPKIEPTEIPEDEIDSDNDGLLDNHEQEIGLDPYNPDSDYDGLADGEEWFDYGTDPGNPDTDEDALQDGDELLEFDTDPFNPDTDQDALSDGEEVFDYGTNPNDIDTDGDNLHDGAGEYDWVIDRWGYPTDPLNPDTDGDSYQDGEEMGLETNPLDPHDPTKVRFAIMSSSDWIGLTVLPGDNIIDSATVDVSGETTIASMDGNRINLNQELSNAEYEYTVAIVQDVTFRQLANYGGVEFKVERGCIGEITVVVYTMISGDPIEVGVFTPYECYLPDSEYYFVGIEELIK